jgi:hypothetical protein
VVVRRKGNSRFPSGRTDRKARPTTNAKVPFRNDRQKSKGNCKGKRRSRFPLGMTDRKAKATAKAKRRSRFPSGMTDRKARATATAKEEADSFQE